MVQIISPASPTPFTVFFNETAILPEDVTWSGLITNSSSATPHDATVEILGTQIAGNFAIDLEGGGTGEVVVHIGAEGRIEATSSTGTNIWIANAVATFHNEGFLEGDLILRTNGAFGTNDGTMERVDSIGDDTHFTNNGTMTRYSQFEGNGNVFENNGSLHTVTWGPNLYGDNNRLINTGSIVVTPGSGSISTRAVHFSDLDGSNPTEHNYLDNHGHIEGFRAVSTNTHLDVVNTGEIYGTGAHAIVATDSSRVHITNSGTIRSDAGVAISAGADTDTIINRGKIVGDVELGAGNDLYDGSGGRVLGYVDGGQGDDEIIGYRRTDSDFRGGEGNDRLVGDSGHDRLDGGDDDDVLIGNRGSDTLLGGDGNDTILGGTGRDTIEGGAGNDDINGGSASDDISGGAGVDTIDGGTHDDTITGGSGNDVIDAGSGDDYVRGDSGDDMIYGNRGDDELDGSSGADTINGGLGRDTINGGFGIGDNDILTGGRDADTFVFFSVLTGDDTITDFETGEDIIDLRALDVDDFDEIAANSTQVGTTVVIDLDALGGEGTVTLLGVQVDDLGADDFLF